MVLYCLVWQVGSWVPQQAGSDWTSQIKRHMGIGCCRTPVSCFQPLRDSCGGTRPEVCVGWTWARTNTQTSTDVHAFGRIAAPTSVLQHTSNHARRSASVVWTLVGLTCPWWRHTATKVCVCVVVLCPCALCVLLPQQAVLKVDCLWSFLETVRVREFNCPIVIKILTRVWYVDVEMVKLKEVDTKFWLLVLYRQSSVSVEPRDEDEENMRFDRETHTYDLPP